MDLEANVQARRIQNRETPERFGGMGIVLFGQRQISLDRSLPSVSALAHATDG